MKTDFEVTRNYQTLATVFNPEFNNFAPISANQAWSLFFTVGRDDAALGSNVEVGKFFNLLLLVVVVAIALSAVTFRVF